MVISPASATSVRPANGADRSERLCGQQATSRRPASCDQRATSNVREWWARKMPDPWVLAFIVTCQILALVGIFLGWW